MNSVYLDYNATSPLWPSVKEAMKASLDIYGNPSSVHAVGRQAQGVVEEARLSLAKDWGVHPAQIIFTGSGSEANNMVFAAHADAHVVTGTTEHSSVLEASLWGARIPVNNHGIIDLKLLERMLSMQKISLLSVMLANNETGVIQDLQAIARLAHSYGCRVHSDCIAAMGKIDVNFQSLGVDYMTVSAHKLGGPKGVGALVVQEGAPLNIFIRGGGQERRRRAGTENITGIVGFAEAIRAMRKVDWKPLARLRDEMEKQLKMWGFSIVGESSVRLPNTTCFVLPSMSAETLLMKYDLAGISLSSGSACSSGKVKKSHVVEAMGYAGESLRVSLGWNTTKEDIDYFLKITESIVHQQNQEAA